MYGKIFADIFNSTLMTKLGWKGVYIFSALIILSDAGGIVRMDPMTLWRRIGLDNQEDGIDFNRFIEMLSNLEAPDNLSNMKTHEGRRIIPLREKTNGQENRGWWVVNNEYYNDLANRIDQDLKPKEPEKSSKEIHFDKASFQKFWEAYPRKKSKGDAEKAFIKLNPSPDLLKEILRAIEVAKLNPNWRKDNGQYIPYPGTWLRARCWEDEDTFIKTSFIKDARSAWLEIEKRISLKTPPSFEDPITNRLVSYYSWEKIVQQPELMKMQFCKAYHEQR